MTQEIEDNFIVFRRGYGKDWDSVSVDDDKDTHPSIPHTCPDHPEVKEWVWNPQAGRYVCPEPHRLPPHPEYGQEIYKGPRKMDS